uniref:transposase n=1 Tax=Rhodococcus rhodochrous TaxID=1829 RepID=UPI002B26F8E6|nr:transposase [Rhodococcus rhodochrous]
MGRVVSGTHRRHPRLDDQLAANEKHMSQALDEHGTRLREVDGVGAVTAARLIGRTDRPDRFPTAAAYANYNVARRGRP